MAIDFDLDGEAEAPRKRFGAQVRAPSAAPPDIELVGTIEFHASDTPDIALGTTSEVGPKGDPDIELVGTNEVSASLVAEAPTPSQLLGEGTHEETAVVDWRNFSEPPEMPRAKPATPRGTSPTVLAPVLRELAGKAPIAPLTAAATDVRAARPAASLEQAPATLVPREAVSAPHSASGTPPHVADATTASSILAGQYAVLTEVVVAMITAMPEREAILRLALRNAERMREFPPVDASVAAWQEGVDRELENFRDLAAGLKNRKSP